MLQESERELKQTAGEVLDQQHALDEHSLVSITDPDGKIIHVNDKFCQASQYPREELIGSDYRIVSSGHHAKSFFENMWATVGRGDVWHGQIKNRAKDGSDYWVTSTLVPFKNQDGEITKYVSIQTEITQNQESEAKAEAANLAKSEFLANMSHEIRTPMTAILGYTELLLQDGDLTGASQPWAENIRTIQRNGEHLLTIINDILDLSKIEAGKMTVERIGCSPHQILADVGTLMRVKADSKRLSLGLECVGPIPRTIQSDPVRLRQVLINLVGNAIKFTERGSVRVIARLGDDRGQDNPRLIFEVMDTGVGLTPQQIDKLFKPFSQADTSTTRKFGGTGLGLTISKLFAELLGGDLTVRSTPGQGTSFVVQIATGLLDGVEMIDKPIEAVVIEPEKTSVKTHETTDRPLENVRILLAEDGLDSQRLISFILKKWGVLVELADNGRIAIDKALTAWGENKPFDVILMDMQMPEVDGYTATRKLREEGYTAVIIALTAHAMAEDRQKCLDSGCVDYATKPINKDQMLATIQSHLMPQFSHTA